MHAAARYPWAALHVFERLCTKYDDFLQCTVLSSIRMWEADARPEGLQRGVKRDQGRGE